MARTNHNYSTMRLKELDGGINTYNSPNEIENKQAVSSVNFNFDGNKLVNSKGYISQTTITDGAFDKHIGGITLDGADIWHISSGTLYKNNVEQTEEGGVFISLNELSAYWLQFKAYIKFWIKINGVDYNPTADYTADTYFQDLITDLQNKLIADGYTVNAYAGGVFVSKPSTTITVSLYDVVIAHEGFISKALTTTGFSAINFYLDGTPYIAGKDISGTDNLGNTVYGIYGNLKDYINTTSSNYGARLLYLIRTGTSPDYVYNISDSTNYNDVGVLINKVTNYSIATFGDETRKIFYETSAGDSFDSASMTIGTDVFTYSGVTPASSNVIFNDLVSQLNTAGYSAKVYTTPSGYFATNNSGNILYIANKTNTGTTYSLSFISGGTNYGNATNGEYALDTIALNLDNSSIYSSNVTSPSAMNGLCDITVGNLGTLVVDKDNGGATYFVDGMMIPIAEDKVGKPTIGTIYQGKVILGGYEGNDNIVHSVTPGISTPFNVLDFSSYNSGGGSVSGGNKSKLTGFAVGENGLYVFKENEIWYSTSATDKPETSSYEFNFNKITSNGALNQAVITNIGQDIFYYDHTNRAVRRLSYEQNLTTLRDTAISNEINTLLKALPDNQKLATAHYKYPLYKLHLSDNTGGTITYPSGKTYYKNNKCFVYNVDNKSWSTEDGYTDVTLSDDNYFIKSYTVTHTSMNSYPGEVPERPEYTTYTTIGTGIYKDQNGFTSSGERISKEFDLGDGVDIKRISEIEIYGKNTDDIPLYCDVYVDNVKKETFTITNNFTDYFRRRFDMWHEGRTIQIGIRYTGVGYIEINELSFIYKPIKGYSFN